MDLMQRRRALLSALRETAIWNIISGNLNTPLFLPQGYGGSNIKHLIQQGLCVQSTTPTPTAPVDIVCNNGTLKWKSSSTNLANVNENTIVIGKYISNSGSILNHNSNFYYNDYIAVKPNTQYTLSTNQSLYFVSIVEYETDKTFIERKTKTPDVTEFTFTTGDSTYFLRFGSNIFGSNSTITLEDILAINWMLNESNEALPYEPYRIGLYVDGTPEILSVGGGFNLFSNAEEQITHYYVNDNTITESPENLTFIMRCTPNTTYYWKHCSLIGGVQAFTVDGDIIVIGNRAKWLIQNPITNTGTEVYSATTDATAKWLCICFGRDSTDAAPLNEQWSDFILSTSILTDATSYVSYQTQTATVQNLFQAGGWFDTQDIISGEVNRQVAIKVLDGTEDWKTTHSGKFNITLSDVKTSGRTPPQCTHFKGTNVTVANMAANTILSSGRDIIIYHSSITNVNTFKTWLADQYAAGTPVIIIYNRLVNPIIEQATPQALTVVDGTNTINIQANVSPIVLNTIEYLTKQ